MKFSHLVESFIHLGKRTTVNQSGVTKMEVTNSVYYNAENMTLF